MYNYKINEYDLADQMMYQMKRDKKVKRTLDICTILFSVFMVNIIMLIIKNYIPEFNMIILGGCSTIVDLVLIFIIMKNYRIILARVYRRDVNKKSDNYDITLEILGRKLKVYRKAGEEEFNINEISLEESEDTTYVMCKRRIIIIPDRIFRSEEEKEEFMKKIKNNK